MIIGNKDEDNEVALKSVHQRESILRQNEIFNNPQTLPPSSRISHGIYKV